MSAVIESFGEIEIISKLIDAEYPDIDRIFSTNSEISLIVGNIYSFHFILRYEKIESEIFIGCNLNIDTVDFFYFSIWRNCVSLEKL